MTLERWLGQSERLILLLRPALRASFSEPFRFVPGFAFPATSWLRLSWPEPEQNVLGAVCLRAGREAIVEGGTTVPTDARRRAVERLEPVESCCGQLRKHALTSFLSFLDNCPAKKRKC